MYINITKYELIIIVALFFNHHVPILLQQFNTVAIIKILSDPEFQSIYFGATILVHNIKFIS